MKKAIAGEAVETSPASLPRPGTFTCGLDVNVTLDRLPCGPDRGFNAHRWSGGFKVDACEKASRTLPRRQREHRATLSI